MERYKELLIDYVHNKTDMTPWSFKDCSYTILKGIVTDAINLNYYIIDAQVYSDVRERESVNNDPMWNIDAVDDSSLMVNIRHYIRKQCREYMLGFMPTDKVADFCLKLYINGYYSATFKDPNTPRPDNIYSSNKMCFGNEGYPFILNRLRKALSNNELEDENDLPWVSDTILTEEHMINYWNRLTEEARSEKSWTLVLCINPNWTQKGMFEHVLQCLSRTLTEPSYVTLNTSGEINTATETLVFTN